MYNSMNIYAYPGTKVVYMGTTEDAVRCSPAKTNPIPILTVGETYTIDHTEPHSWYTNVFLKEIEGEFNSCWFKDAEPLKVKDHVRGQVQFMYYRNKELWYKTETNFEFPVPIEDTGDGIFLAQDKAILFMRYIRKHMKMLEDARQS